MNDLGWFLAWLAVQVALLLVPAVVVQSLAARRGSASGSWIATWSLGLVVALDVAACLPAPGPAQIPPPRVVPSASAGGKPVQAAIKPNAVIERSEALRGRGSERRFDWRAVWGRLSWRPAGPVERVRPWGWVIAVGTLAGMGCGLLRLLLGLWAVGHCRRRGRVIADAVLVDLVAELRGAMGCHPPVEIREVADLATPATAGWRRPVLLLPTDWRSWDATERRAVVAHELAHVLRRDYAANLLGGIAVALNYHNPLVRWMAGRLTLGQELAADALGARFSGGPAAYLVVLAGLALKQEAWSPGWPARAFLPARGTLIRRIAMLKHEVRTNVSPRFSSSPGQVMTALGLLALALGVATLRSPVRGDDKLAAVSLPTGPKVESPADRAVELPLDSIYVPDSEHGVLAVRPAAISRRLGKDRLAPLVNALFIAEADELAATLQVDTTQPGFRRLESEEIESILLGFHVGVGPEDPKEPGRKLHCLMTNGLTVRMAAPFDWFGFLRQWKVEIEAVQDRRSTYYKLKVPKILSPTPVFAFLPDDRTLVVDTEQWIQEVVRREVPSAPTYLRGADWEQASRGLLAVAITNKANSFDQQFDRGRPDEAMVLPLFQGVDRWILGVSDTRDLARTGAAGAGDPQSAESVARAVNALVQLGRATLAATPPAADANARDDQMARALLAHFQVKPDGSRLALAAEGFGTLVEFAEILKIKLDAGAQVKAGELGTPTAAPDVQFFEVEATDPPGADELTPKAQATRAKPKGGNH